MWAGTDGGGLYATTDGAATWHARDIGEPGVTETTNEEAGTPPDYDREITEHTSEVENDPNDSDAHNQLGLAYYGKGDLEAAAEQLARAIELNPESDVYHSNLGFVRFDQHRYDDAIRLFDQELEMYPDNPDAMAGKAICLQAMGQSAPALELYDGAVQRDVNYMDCKVLHATYYWTDSACKTAQPLIDKLLR